MSKPRRERITLHVTVTIWHDGTKASRQDAIAEARECVLSTRNLRVAEPKRATLLGDDMIIIPKAVWDLARTESRQLRAERQADREDPWRRLPPEKRPKIVCQASVAQVRGD